MSGDEKQVVRAKRRRVDAVPIRTVLRGLVAGYSRSAGAARTDVRLANMLGIPALMHILSFLHVHDSVGSMPRVSRQFGLIPAEQFHVPFLSIFSRDTDKRDWDWTQVAKFATRTQTLVLMRVDDYMDIALPLFPAVRELVVLWPTRMAMIQHALQRPKLTKLDLVLDSRFDTGEVWPMVRSELKAMPKRDNLTRLTISHENSWLPLITTIEELGLLSRRMEVLHIPIRLTAVLWKQLLAQCPRLHDIKLKLDAGHDMDAKAWTAPPRRRWTSVEVDMEHWAWPERVRNDEKHLIDAFLAEVLLWFAHADLEELLWLPRTNWTNRLDTAFWQAFLPQLTAAFRGLVLPGVTMVDVLDATRARTVDSTTLVTLMLQHIPNVRVWRVRDEGHVRQRRVDDATLARAYRNPHWAFLDGAFPSEYFAPDNTNTDAKENSMYTELAKALSEIEPSRLTSISIPAVRWTGVQWNPILQHGKAWRTITLSTTRGPWGDTHIAQETLMHLASLASLTELVLYVPVHAGFDALRAFSQHPALHMLHLDTEPTKSRASRPNLTNVDMKLVRALYNSRTLTNTVLMHGVVNEPDAKEWLAFLLDIQEQWRDRVVSAFHQDRFACLVPRSVATALGALSADEPEDWRPHIQLFGSIARLNIRKPGARMW